MSVLTAELIDRAARAGFNVDEINRCVDRLSRLHAEKMSLELGITHDECADLVKKGFYEGRLVIEVHPDGKCYRLALAADAHSNPSGAASCT
jgi:hypothetical protein